MAKGRRNIPTTKRDGIWYDHRGETNSAGYNWPNATSTGRMLSGPFSCESALRPLKPPSPFEAKAEVTFIDTNKFSEHDNRNALQDHGVYLGNGRDTRYLGRRLRSPKSRSHHTDNTFLKHYGRLPTDFSYNTVQSDSYQGDSIEDPPEMRRFPKICQEPQEGRIKLDTTTSDWFKCPDIPHKTPLHVLAVSQEPYLQHNAWKYSQNGPKTVYPPYDTKHIQRIRPIPNRYGAAFASE